jgi:pimeloyl-ACP methyl ester carboxylesterase
MEMCTYVRSYMTTTATNETEIKRPLIFVPGIMASRLAVKEGGGAGSKFDFFWPPPADELLMPDIEEKILKYLRTKVRTSPDEADDVPVIATDLFPMAYDELITALEMMGYIPNVNFWIFPYDWRQSNDVSAHLLSRFIKEKIQTGSATLGWKDVDIICHSMGGLVTRAVYKKYGGESMINRIVYIACPHFGDPLSYFSLHPDIHIQGFFQFFDQPHIEAVMHVNLRRNSTFPLTAFYEQLKDAFSKFPSMYELMPDDFYLQNRPMLIADNTPIMDANNTYLGNGWAFKKADMVSNVKAAMKFKNDLGGQLLLPDEEGGDDKLLLLICGANVKTDDTIRYEKSDYAAGGDAGHSDSGGDFTFPFDSGQEGDSWVPLMSAMASNEISKALYKNTMLIDGGEHLTLSNDIRTIEAVRNFLFT